MDFYSFSRKDLQALCKKNKIPANMTNVAMADALKALQNIEGIEDVRQAISPTKVEARSPDLPRTCRRTSTRRKPTKEVPISSEDAAASPDLPRTCCRTSTRGKPTKEIAISMENMPGEHTESSRRVTRTTTRRIIGKEEEPEKEDKKSGIPETPVTQIGPKRVIRTSVRRRINTCNKEDEQKEERKDDKSSVNRVDTRRSSRLLSEKKSSEDALSITKHQEKREIMKIQALSEEFEDLERKSKEGFENFDVSVLDSKESIERRNGVFCDEITQFMGKFPPTQEFNKPSETENEDSEICDPDPIGNQDEVSGIVDAASLDEVCSGRSKAFDVISGDDWAAEEHLGEICNPEAIPNLQLSSEDVAQVCLDVWAPVQESIEPPPENRGVEKPHYDSDAALQADPDSNGDLNIGLEMSGAASEDLVVEVEKLTKDLAEDQMLDSKNYSGNIDQICNLKTVPALHLSGECDQCCEDEETTLYATEIPTSEKGRQIKNQLLNDEGVYCDGDVSGKFLATEVYEPSGSGEIGDPDLVGNQDKALGDPVEEVCRSITDAVEESSLLPEICRNLESKPSNVDSKEENLICSFQLECKNLEQIQFNPVSDANQQADFDPQEAFDLISSGENLAAVEKHVEMCNLDEIAKDLPVEIEKPTKDLAEDEMLDSDTDQMGGLKTAPTLDQCCNDPNSSSPMDNSKLVQEELFPDTEETEKLVPEICIRSPLGKQIRLISEFNCETEFPSEKENTQIKSKLFNYDNDGGLKRDDEIAKSVGSKQIAEIEGLSLRKLKKLVGDRKTATTLDQCCEDPNSSSPMENPKLVGKELIPDTKETENLVHEICIQRSPLGKQIPLISEFNCETEFPSEKMKGTPRKSKLLNYDDKENNNNSDRGLKRDDEISKCVGSKKMAAIEDLSLRKLKKLVKETIHQHTKVKSDRRSALEPLSENRLLE